MTFHTNVPPILYQNWVVCHDPNDIGPMSIITPRFLMLKGNESGPRVALRDSSRASAVVCMIGTTHYSAMLQLLSGLNSLMADAT